MQNFNGTKRSMPVLPSTRLLDLYYNFYQTSFMSVQINLDICDGKWSKLSDD